MSVSSQVWMAALQIQGPFQTSAPMPPAHVVGHYGQAPSSTRTRLLTKFIVLRRDIQHVSRPRRRAPQIPDGNDTHGRVLRALASCMCVSRISSRRAPLAVLTESPEVPPSAVIAQNCAVRIRQAHAEVDARGRRDEEVVCAVQDPCKVSLALVEEYEI